MHCRRLPRRSSYEAPPPVFPPSLSSSRWRWPLRSALQNATEMGVTLVEVVARVQAPAFYVPLFTDALGDAEVTTERISLALAQFVRSLVSYRSRYDNERAAHPNANDDPGFTAEENCGKAIFLTGEGDGRSRAGGDGRVPQVQPRLVRRGHDRSPGASLLDLLRRHHLPDRGAVARRHPVQVSPAGLKNAAFFDCRRRWTLPSVVDDREALRTSGPAVLG
ncbi:MAG: cytochrome-c peroxidase [Myxococcota bacterium]